MGHTPLDTNTVVLETWSSWEYLAIRGPICRLVGTDSVQVNVVAKYSTIPGEQWLV